MNGGDFQQHEIDLAVGLVNTWDVLDDEPEFLGSVTNLRSFLDEHGLEREARVATEGDLTRVRSLRRRVRSVFEADTEAEAVETLNDLLADAVPQLRPDKKGWRFSYEPRRARDLADRLAPRVAAALLVAIQTEGWERFGVCDALPCRCVYLDRSRNRSRRYCCHLCADRSHQQASRARRGSLRR
jgi:predicted RNA-binding Zn ribbon-like protein